MSTARAAGQTVRIDEMKRLESTRAGVEQGGGSWFAPELRSQTEKKDQRTLPCPYA